MYYEGQCGSCNNFVEEKGSGLYDQRNSSNTKGWCTSYRASYYPTESSCSRYSRRKDLSSSNCYITTMVCSILGYSDQCDVLNTLRGFRHDVLQKDEKYAGILYEYDVVGPEIAKHLKQEEISFVDKIYCTFLLPIVSFIREKKTEEAISKYVQMTESLKECYGIEFQEDVPATYDYQHGGHGVEKVKKNYRLAF